MKKVCTRCKTEWEDAEMAFCEACGAELPEAVAEEPGEPEVPEVPAAIDFDALLRRFPAEAEIPEPPLGEGAEPIRVEYRKDIFLLAGVQIPLGLRITAGTEKAADVLVWMKPLLANGGEVREIAVPGRLQPGRPLEIEIPYLPPESLSGVVSFCFYFGVSVESELKFYEMTVGHRIYRKDRSAENIVTNISYVVSEAGTVNARHGDVAPAADGRSNDAMLDRIATLPRIFAAQQLTESAWRSEDSLVAERPYLCDALTLEIDGFRYQLLSKRSVKFGRKPELNDLVVGNFMEARNPNDYPNNTISRVHAQLDYDGDRVMFFDASSHGTYLNGVRPGGEGMAVPQDAAVEFGDIHFQMQTQRCEQKGREPLCTTCPHRKIRAITFRRKDRVPEAYWLVWKCCEAGEFDPLLTGFAVYRRNGGFLLRTPARELIALVPGRRFRFENRQIAVNHFQQCGPA